MPDKRRHRGAHPQDADSFRAEVLPQLRLAAHDLAWLLTRGYACKAAVKLVGDRYSLRERQRSAVQRSTVGDAVRDRRKALEVGVEAVRDADVLLDAYNILLTVESALGGGIVLASRDGAFRDMASMSGHYKRVEQTIQALQLIGRHMDEAGVRQALWYLDRPISNSGRLKALMQEVAAENGWTWTVELVASPDRVLASGSDVIVTADGWIIDQGRPWLNLARLIIAHDVPDAWIVDLG